jgi:tetratricopeptide (TPR) repeat protein
MNRRTATLLIVFAGLAQTVVWSQDDFVARARKAKAEGRAEDAIGLLEEGLHAQPDNAPAHFVLAWLYLERGQKVQATAAFREVVALSPQSEEGREAKAALERLGAAPATPAPMPGRGPAVAEPGPPPVAPAAVEEKRPWWKNGEMWSAVIPLLIFGVPVLICLAAAAVRWVRQISRMGELAVRRAYLDCPYCGRSVHAADGVATPEMTCESCDKTFRSPTYVE